MKTRMTTVDVVAEVACLRSMGILGMRVSNVYDINPRTYLIKLSRSGADTGESHKVLLLLESATRFHATQFARDKSSTPSNFTVKLRKHLRTRRLESITQAGMDRVVDFQFGSGDAAHHLVLELYAQGNIILTDSQRNIMTLLRSYKDEDKGVCIMANQPYSPQASQELRGVSREAVTDELRVAAEACKPLKHAVARLLPYGPSMGEQCILAAQLDPTTTVDASLLADSVVDKLTGAIKHACAWLQKMREDPPTLVPEGVITLRPASKDDPEGLQVNDEFLPAHLAQFKSGSKKDFKTFDAAMDDFFSKFEEQRAEVQVRAQKKAVMGKLDKIRSDQERRVAELAAAAEAEDRRAQLIEYNLGEVDAAIGAVNEALASGMDWSQLKMLIRQEKKAGNPVAGLVHELHLERNTITLLLSNTLDDADEEEMTRPVDKVEVDLSLSAHANAAQHFSARKKSTSKQLKTLEATGKVMKQAERRAAQDAAKVTSSAKITQLRKPRWFEKFDWCISSENFLVLCARDKIQGDLLVRRYLATGDVFVHSDVNNTPCCVVKNPAPDQSIPPLTLSQAGHLVMCKSDAWDSKMVTSAWWVHPHQVSKESPAGTLLPGQVHISGLKHFLPPSQLIMGYGLMFEVDPESAERHKGERRIKSSADEVADNSAVVADKDVYASAGHIIDEAADNSGVIADEDADKDQDDATSLDADLDEDGKCVADASCDEVDGKEANALSAFMDSTPRVASSIGVPTTNKQASCGLPATHPRSEVSKQLDATSEMELSGVNSSRNGGSGYLTAKQRRQMKKGKVPATGLSAGINADQHDDANSTALEALPVGISLGEALDKRNMESDSDHVGSLINEPGEGDNNNSRLGGSMQQKVRGKKGKLKKMKDKYADQDEDDREMAMLILGAAGKSKQADKEDCAPPNDKGKLKARAASAKGGQQKVQASGGAQSFQPTPKTGREVGGDTPADNVTESGLFAVSKSMHANQQEMNEIESGDFSEQLIQVSLNDIDLLTGCPFTTDTVVCALPVCAPYSLLQGYKYKVKVTPGSQKKGRAARQAMDAFKYNKDATPAEKAVFASVKDPDLIPPMLANVKISMPGLERIKSAVKSAKKRE